jgi:rRNA maturation RNase YbeY
MIDINFEEIEPINEVNEEFLTQWLDKVTQQENKKLGELTFIFTSDEYLLEVNKQYLEHDYYTDIITFDYCEDDYVSGDLFISIDRVKENAQINNTTFQNELNRVIVHGVLHLCGYKDKTEDDEQLMRHKENQMLNLI